MISLINEIYSLDKYDSLVEELTFQGIMKHGEVFLDKIYEFLESGMEDISLVESYYDDACILLLEEEPSFRETLGHLQGEPNEYKRAKISADFLKKSMEHEIGKEKEKKPGIISQAISKLGKTKVGRAITRGAKRAMYGSELGRKILQKKAEFQAKEGERSTERGKVADVAARKFAITAAVSKTPAVDLLFTKALGKHAVKSGLLGQKYLKAADRQERKLHLLSKVSPKAATKPELTKSFPRPGFKTVSATA